MVVRIMIGLSSLAVCAVPTSANFAFDLTADLTAQSNPNGAWSYGYKLKDANGKPTGSFHLFTTGVNDWMGPHWYTDTGTNGGEIWRNDTNRTQFDIPAGRCSLNGDAHSTSTARWTAPVSGVVDVSISLWPSSSRRYVMLGDELLAEGSYANPMLAVVAGDTLDVTLYGAPAQGNTVSDIQIRYIPEPATVGVLAIMGLALRRVR